MTLGPLGLIDLDNPPPTLAQPIIELAEQYLIVPTGPGAGRPLRLTGEQVELLWAWYSTTPNGRRFVFNRRLLMRMPKGWAKSPIGAIDMFAGLVGDVLPDGLNANGEPVGRPHPSPWLQVAATAEDQTDNLYGQLYEMLRDSPAIDDLRLDVGVTMTRFRDRPGKIEPVTSSAGAREGQPISGVALEETQGWKPSNGGVALARTLNRNALKMGARAVEMANAYIPGAKSVVESTEKAIQRGAVGVLRVVREVEAGTDPRNRRTVRKALEGVYGQAALKRKGWIDTDDIAEAIVGADDDEMPSLLRFFFNWPQGEDEAVADLAMWSQMANVDLRLVEGDTIALGFDGSESGDATALYACRWPDWLLVPLAVWAPPTDELGHRSKGWRVNRAEVKDKVRWACSTFRVVRGYFDDAGWQSDIDELTGELGKAVMRFPHRIDRRIGPACERWTTMTEERTLRHDGNDPWLPEHMANARRVPIGGEGSRWWRPARRVEGQPIDAFSAAVSAVHALGDAVAHGEHVEEKPPPQPMFALS